MRAGRRSLSETDSRRRWRWLIPVALLALVAGIGFVGWQWWASRVPETYALSDMGTADFGGGPAHDHSAVGGAGSAVEVADLSGPASGDPDVSYELTARQEGFRLASGEDVEGFTVDGSSPGPALEAAQGDLVQVTLVNENVAEGATLHWHGVDVPNAEDGVAGVTQDAVPPGERHVYRFVAEDAGTYWYHSHQVSHEQVRGGLFGTLVVHPASAADEQDVVAAVHTYDGRRALNGSTEVTAVEAEEGSSVRVRVVNTDNGPLKAWVSGSPFRVVAVDGRDVNEPTEVRDEGLLLTGGGRMDVVVEAPARIDVGGGTALVVGPRGTELPAAAEPKDLVDLLRYGSPADLPFDVDAADRSFEYRIDQRIGFLDGRPGRWWTINGKLFPDVPMFHVAEGDVVRMTITNDSGDVHPMHLHGHHAVVLSRDGVEATGSPWWVDSLNVPEGQTFEIAFLADNPGIWMDHCHNLDHARDGLVAHMAYDGVAGSYEIGGPAGNEPE